ncbi:MAG: LacI family DNA-binding transcriptional regulator [Chitinophagaceae bacterium]|nr:LacI family DNA-binding transcriptional regulator [Chitinophagaceae bacterium]
MESVNIKKLANILNISISTVSKALRDSHDISKETKEKVIALASELNYQPNPHASSLRKAKSKTIAVIIPEIANNYFSLAINGIESIAQEKGYHVLIYLTHESYLKEVALIRLLHGGRVDGILISLSSTTTDYSHLEEVQGKGLPLVFFDRVCENLNTVSITTDDYESAYNATKHLIGQGCKKIAHLMISKNLSIGNKRLKGYLKALEELELPVDETMIINCTNEEETNFELIKILLQEKRPDGIFAAVERYAISAYEASKQLNISIPKDLKIISFSNLQTASLLNPSLTTITQPAFDIGRQAATILFRALEEKRYLLKNEHIVFKSELIERESTSK